MLQNRLKWIVPMTVWAAVLVGSPAQTGSPSAANRQVFEVPEGGDGVRLSSLIVVKRTEQLEGEREPGDPLQFRNLRIVPSLGEPVVKAGDNKLTLFAIIYPDRQLPYEPRLGLEFSRAGQVIGATQPQLPPDRNEEGDIPLIITFPLDYFDPGDYRVRLVAQQGDTVAESRTEFGVVSP